MTSTPNDGSTPDAISTPKRSRLGENFFTIIIIAALIGGVFWFKRAAPMPEGFAHITLAAANDQAKAADKPVVAVFTASWCGSCQSYKRGALTNSTVTEWLGENAVAVMIDIDEYPEAAEAAGIRSVPTTVVLRDGKIVAATSGAQGANSLIGWLDRATSVN